MPGFPGDDMELSGIAPLDEIPLKANLVLRL
jgi:hypothetical protein